MKNFVFYTLIAIRDTLRLRVSLLTTLMTVIGICLPLVLLLGLTAGLVKRQEATMLRSPTACQLSLWVTSGQASPLSKSVEAQLEQTNAGIDVVIPEIKKVVDVHSSNCRQIAALTLLCTKPGDRLLAFYLADVLTTGEKGIVLSRATADQLGVRYSERPERGFAVAHGQRITVTVSRSTADHRRDKVQLEVQVRAVADFGGSTLAYMDRQLLDWIEDFQQGRAVKQLGWPALAQNSPVAFEGYVCFSKQPLSILDQTKLRARGLTLTALNPTDSRHADCLFLGGLLKAHSLSVYYLGSGPMLTSGAAIPQLTLSAREVEDITDADDIMVAWSHPLEARLDGDSCQIVGVSLQKRWLRSFFHHPEAAFDGNVTELRVQRNAGNSATVGRAGTTEHNNLVLPSGQSISFQLHDPTATTRTKVPPGLANLLQAIPPALDDITGFFRVSGGHETAPQKVRNPRAQPSTAISLASAPSVIVPAASLAQLRALERGEVAFDESLRLFVPKAKENLYYQARVYARNLYAVPEVDQALRAAGYTTQSERTRVEEIQGYARTLDLLVLMVGGTVFIFGTWTLIAVLFADTARKRGSIGILRVMGVSRFGILYLVIVRAAMIGLIAGAVLVPISVVLARLLTNYLALCELRPLHLALVFALAIVSCLLGVIGPAIRASRMDPVDAIAQANAQ